MKQALAIFAKTPFPGLVKTRLSPPLSLEAGAELYRCMLLDTLLRVRQLGVETFVFYEGDASFFQETVPEDRLVAQHPGGLGERLEEAFSRLAAWGYERRVVLGSDAPDLPVEFIREAFGLLDRGKDAVFGPAEDGGYYLVGLTNGAAGDFRDIPWSTSRALEKSLERAREAGLSSGLLPIWYDVDSYEDLQRPGLLDPANGAPLTRAFLSRLFGAPSREPGEADGGLLHEVR